MTEAEWMACTEPENLLLLMKEKVSERKLLLVASACCRRIWHLLDGWSQNVVEGAEKHVDGLTGQTAMTFAAELHEDIILKAEPYTARHIAAGIVNSMIRGAAWPLAWNTVSEVRRAIRASSPRSDTFQELRCQAAIVREIFGNPFRPVSVAPAWLTWHDGLIVSMARQMYDSRDFGDLPVLADALEEAGCDNADILAHCRQPGPHVRGCWVVDLLLGKS